MKERGEALRFPPQAPHLTESNIAAIAAQAQHIQLGLTPSRIYRALAEHRLHTVKGILRGVVLMCAERPAHLPTPYRGRGLGGAVQVLSRRMDATHVATRSEGLAASLPAYVLHMVCFIMPCREMRCHTQLGRLPPTTESKRVCTLATLLWSSRVAKTMLSWLERPRSGSLTYALSLGTQRSRSCGGRPRSVHASTIWLSGTRSRCVCVCVRWAALGMAGAEWQACVGGEGGAACDRGQDGDECGDGAV